MFVTLTNGFRRVAPPIVSKAPFSACSLRRASHRPKVKTAENVLTADALFPPEEGENGIHRAAADEEELSVPNFAAAAAAAPELQTFSQSVYSAKNAEFENEEAVVDGDTFGTLASPETRKKIRDLDNLWPLTGWNDNLEGEEDGKGEMKRETGSKSTKARLPALVGKENDDEALKPSLLYPGDSVKRALSRGPRSSVRVQDGDERRDIRYYQSKIDKLIHRGYVREALQLYEVGMKLEEQIEPNFPVYNSLMKGCGRIGDVDRAFAFYSRMRERGDSLIGETYASLFHACRDCDSSSKGLEIANQVWAHLKDDDFYFVAKNKKIETRLLYNLYMRVLLKNRLPDRIFELYDEMIDKKIAPDSFTSVHVLRACSQDEDDGFAKALLCWKSFRSNSPNAKLTVSHYVALVAAAASAGVERPDLIAPLLLPNRHDAVPPNETLAYLERLSLPEVVEKPLRSKMLRWTSRLDRERIAAAAAARSKRSEENNPTTIATAAPPLDYDGQLSSSPVSSSDASPSSSLDPSVEAPSSPSSLALRPIPPVSSTATDSNDARDAAHAVSTPYDRLSMIGGAEKIIERMMQSERTRPADSMIFVELLRCYGPGETRAIEGQLELMDRVGVRPDEQWIAAAIRYALARAKEDGDDELTKVWRLIRVAETRGIPVAPRTFRAIAFYVKTPAAFARFELALRESRLEPTADTFAIAFRVCGDDFWLRRRIFEVMTEEYLLRPEDDFRKWLEAKLRRSKTSEIKEFVGVYERWLKSNRLEWDKYGDGS